jgi:hypothetical protein
MSSLIAGSFLGRSKQRWDNQARYREVRDLAVEILVRSEIGMPSLRYRETKTFYVLDLGLTQSRRVTPQPELRLHPLARDRTRRGGHRNSATRSRLVEDASLSVKPRAMEFIMTISSTNAIHQIMMRTGIHLPS